MPQPAHPRSTSFTGLLTVLLAVITIGLGPTQLGAGELQVEGSTLARPFPGSSYEWGQVLASGDFNADGQEDLVTADPAEGNSDAPSNGVARIFLGGPEGQQFERFFFTSGGEGACSADPSAALGAALAVGDFDGDGIDDLAIGMPGRDVTRADTSTANGAGTVILLFGEASAFPFFSSKCLHLELEGLPIAALDGDGFGSALAAGDFDNDGTSDLAVGIPGRTVDGADEAGMVAVFYGDDMAATSFDLPRTTVLRQGTADVPGLTEPGDRFGSSLVAGDFLGGDQIGCDLAVGVPGEDIAEVDQGAVHVFFGCLPGTGLTEQGSILLQIADVSLVNAQEGQEFGRFLAAGDLGFDEGFSLFVGAPGHDTFLVVDGTLDLYSDVGAVFVFSGDLASAPAVRTWDALALIDDFPDDPTSMRIGTTMAVGKVGSGPDHMLIGAPGDFYPECGFGCQVTEGRVAYVPGGPGWQAAQVSSRSRTISLSSPGAPEPPNVADYLGAGLTFCDFGAGVRAAIGIPGRAQLETLQTEGAVWLLTSDILFDDGFESGDLSAWSSFTP